MNPWWTSSLALGPYDSTVSGQNLKDSQEYILVAESVLSLIKWTIKISKNIKNLQKKEKKKGEEGKGGEELSCAFKISFVERR